MTFNHTPEPWVVYKGAMNMDGGLNPFFRGIVALLKHSGEDDDVAVILDRNESAVDYEANSRRIVACVNACAGIPIEEVEKCSPDGKVAMECWTDLAADLAAVRIQRDILATMLGRVTTAFHIERGHADPTAPEGLDIRVCTVGICPVVTEALEAVGK
ncbi:MAG TPA: hypothetical protein VIP09_15995 [Dehalococcoidia bacterium]|jgi:hypothetical protein